MSLKSFLTDLGGIVGRIEDAAARGETDPLKLVDAITNGGYSQVDDSPWWEMFGLETKPTTRGELRGAWNRWAARNHPDKGGSETAFRSMRRLYEAKLTALDPNG